MQILQTATAEKNSKYKFILQNKLASKKFAKQSQKIAKNPNKKSEDYPSLFFYFCSSRADFILLFISLLRS